MFTRVTGMVLFFVVAILAAVLPTIIYALVIWWLDRYEKEPVPLLVAAFLWGSVPAICLALFFEFIFDVPIANSPLGPTATTWALAPVVEEFVKAIAIVALFIFARREFDGPLDGIVYGALIGFGFSMTENLLYFIYHPTSLSTLFWFRSIIFGFNHALFTSIVGLALGAVRYAPQRWLGYVVLPLSLIGATLLHSLHNFALHFQILGAAFSWAVQSTGVLTVIAIATLAWSHEQRWIEEELGEEIANGTIAASDYAEVLFPARRTRSHLRVLANHGVGAYFRTRRLHHLMIELAFCKYQLRVGDRFQECAERDRLRREIVALRSILANGEKVLGRA